MNGGVTIPDKDTARALNDLARHKAIVRILNDIRMDMEICEIEGWDKTEYLNLIRQLLNSIGGTKTMDNLISRQAAIDAMNEWLRLYAINRTMSNVTSIQDILRKLPSAQPEQQWIPWDGGRFPDDSETYIVTAYDGVKERVTFAKYQKRLKRWELTGARAYWRVLAWMPLPESYQAERREE